jgi:hypothetical protein
MANKKAKKKKKASKKHTAARAAAKKTKKKAPRARRVVWRRSSALAETGDVITLSRKGLGPGAAGQAGDLQGLAEAEDVENQSVEELVEEGQPFEAEVVSGVERADNADEKEVQTSESLEDDVPEEYRGERE